MQGGSGKSGVSGGQEAEGPQSLLTVSRGVETQAGTGAGCSEWTEACAWGLWLLMSTDGKALAPHRPRMGERSGHVKSGSRSSQHIHA